MAWVAVNEEGAREVESGALHVFAKNVVRAEAAPGEWVEVTHNGQTLAYGFFNPRSAIAVRVLAWDDEEPEEVIARRIERCYVEKRRMYGETFRWVFGEGDLLPGLVVDKFEDVCVVRNQSLGLEKYMDTIVDVLASHAGTVYLKNKGKGRVKEGLPEEERFAVGSKTRVRIREGEVEYMVDVVEGQKTGFYLDQRDNRIEFGRLVNGGRVLDVFAYSGGFGLHAAVKGAEVTFVERGAKASRLLRENIELNGVEATVVRKDAITAMKELINRGKQFDVVVLDPPALAKKDEDKKKALRTYYKVNQLAAELVEDGGLVVTCSCSHPITPKDFMGVIRHAFAPKGIRMLGGMRGQAKDHTVYLPQPETLYLKCIFGMVGR